MLSVGDALICPECHSVTTVRSRTTAKDGGVEYEFSCGDKSFRPAPEFKVDPVNTSNE